MEYERRERKPTSPWTYLAGCGIVCLLIVIVLVALFMIYISPHVIYVDPPPGGHLP